MKFDVHDRVRIIAWTVPGVSQPTVNHIVCGKAGPIVQVRTTTESSNSDGLYRVKIDGGTTWWFRACDLVAEDSTCSCDSTARQEATICLVHERPDYDPTQETTERLYALIHDLEG